MQDYNDKDQNQNIRRMPQRGQSGRPSKPSGQAGRPPQGRPTGRPSQQGAQSGGRQGQAPGRPPQDGRPVRPSQGRPAGRPSQQGGQAGRLPQGQATGRPPQQGGRPARPSQGRPAGRPPQGAAPQAPGRNGNRNINGNTNGNRSANTGPNRNIDRNTANRTKKKVKNNISPQQAAKKKRKKILLFVAEIFLLLILVGALWVVKKAQNIQIVEIDNTKVKIDKEVQTIIQKEGNSKKGYRNIALFGVDSRSKQLDKNTLSDVIMIASINLDTKEVKLVSVYRDTWLNMSTDTYNKANAAYSKGGPEQAISMLNMNLDLDITDFVTVGFDGLADVIDAVGGVEIDVKEAEIVHLNSYQKSMVGHVVGKNAAGEDEFDAVPYVEYTPVEHAGLQKLNGLQATAYCRIRYVGNDFERTARQRTVLTLVAKKAMTLNPATLDKIANAALSKVKTSLDTQEILSLLSGIASYQIGEQSGFPFEGSVKTGRVGKASVVIPVDLNYNVKLLHAFLFGNENYEPSETVKKCSQKIASDTGVSYKGE